MATSRSPSSPPLAQPGVAGTPGDSGSTFRGVVYALGGFFLFASSDAIVKAMTAHYSIFQLLAFQVPFAALPLALMVRQHGGVASLRPVYPALVALRGLLAGLGGICSFLAFSMLPLADVYAIAFGVPIVVTMLSIPVLGERVGIHRWSAVLVGFLGILVMVQPGATTLSIGHVGALLTVFAGAGVSLILRRIGRVENGPALVLTVLIGLMVLSWPMAALTFKMPSAAHLGLMATSGLLMGIAQFAMLQAFRMAPAASVSAMHYTVMIWALIYGVTIFGDPIRSEVLAGAAIVIGSSLYILHRERVRASGE